MENKVLIGLFLLLLISDGFAQGDRREQRQQRRQQDSQGTVYAKADDGTEFRWTIYRAPVPGRTPPCS